MHCKDAIMIKVHFKSNDELIIEITQFSIRNSMVMEIVKMTKNCVKLQENFDLLDFEYNIEKYEEFLIETCSFDEFMNEEYKKHKNSYLKFDESFI